MTDVPATQRFCISRAALTCAVAFPLVLGGCKTTGQNGAADATDTQQSLAEQSLRSRVGRPFREPVAETPTYRPSVVPGRAPSTVGRVPTLSDPEGIAFEGNSRAPRLGAKTVDAFVPALPVAQFIDVVFGEMLDVPYVTGPDVADQAAVVQIRSGGTLPARDFLALVSDALEQYGVRVVPRDGVYQIVSDSSLRAQIPDFIKSRARLRTRSDLRPVIQFVELQAIDVNSMLNFLTQAFGQGNDRLKITVAQSQGYMILSGFPEDVDAAIAIIRELDELDYAGSQVVRYSPRYWEVGELSTALASALRIEGWEVSTQVGLTRTVTLLPVEFSNDLFVFARTPQAQARVSEWMREFDQAVSRGDQPELFIYQVRNVDASELASIANNALSGTGGINGLLPGDATIPGLEVGLPQDAGNSILGQDRNAAGSAGPFTVDPIGNRLIFSGTAVQYEKLLELLEELDTPGPEVLIEVQIAEVTLNDNTSFGIELFDNDLFDGNASLRASTDGLGLGGAGLNARLLTGDIDAALNAFASNRRVKVLSTPILTARSGVAAEIQVGQDVPIITAQRAADNQSGGGNTDILQQVAYRKTGVLLAIEPIVFSNDRIDLTISQEVSSTIDAAGAVSSPTISNRSLSTQLSLEDGETAVLGGLIQETTIQTENGVPLLKDIPVVGNLFSSDSYSVDRTELVVLITAYVLRGQQDRSQFVRELSGRLDRSLNDDSRMFTLKPANF